MSMMPVETIFALTLLAQPLPIVTIDSQEPISCLSADEMREAVSDGRVIQPAQASRHARNAAPGEVVRIRLCRQGDEFVYVVTTLKRDGRVARVTLEGQSGKVSTIR
ncbi:PepSY domain-containing protein [Bosea sp. 2RAB26]|uniref:PepSY domain-containing protein n=1 Tax=Bosea sp. 2RAB26 TaxID=3237476 RepID=UPI003F923FE5